MLCCFPASVFVSRHLALRDLPESFLPRSPSPRDAEPGPSSGRSSSPYLPSWGPCIRRSGPFAYRTAGGHHTRQETQIEDVQQENDKGELRSASWRCFVVSFIYTLVLALLNIHFTYTLRAIFTPTPRMRIESCRGEVVVNIFYDRRYWHNKGKAHQRFLWLQRAPLPQRHGVGSQDRSPWKARGGSGRFQVSVAQARPVGAGVERRGPTTLAG